MPEQPAGGGWVCRHCVRGVPYTGITPKPHESPGDLWRDHQFEESPDWVNAELARADTLAFCRFGRGMTSAYLLPVDGDRVQGAQPAHAIPLRRDVAS